jgi:hypothetical protein
LIPLACSSRVPRPGSDCHAGFLLEPFFDFLGFFLDHMKRWTCALLLVGST